MALKKLEDFKEGEVEKLTEEQYDALQQDGEVEVSEIPAAEKEPEKTPEPEGGKAPEPKEPEKEPEPPVKTPEQREAEREERLANLERANAGLKEELIRERHRRQEKGEQTAQEQSELIKRILSVPDGEFLDATTVKEGILADQQRERAVKKQQEEYINQVEESKELAMARYTDYEATIKDGLPAYVSSLPEERRLKLLKYIAEAPDPAEMGYTFGLRGMALVKKPGPEISKVKPKEPEAAEPPVILRTGKGSTTSAADKSIEELVFGGYSAEDLEKMAIEAEKERSRGG